jgi:hypothetical protein
VELNLFVLNKSNGILPLNMSGGLLDKKHKVKKKFVTFLFSSRDELISHEELVE